MNYLKIDTNRENTIIKVSGEPFKGIDRDDEAYNNLATHEFQVESDYDFPTGQPVIFYRWNGDEFSGYVEVNSEETIKLYAEEEGTLSGLDLEPYIDNVIGGDFTPLITKDVVIEGVNFSPFSQVEITGEGNFVNTMYFDSPKQLTVNITVADIDGSYNLIVRNDDLHSQDSGYNKITIKSKTVVDFRTTPILDMGLEMTSGVSVVQDDTLGVTFNASSSSWNRGVKFTSYFWNRNDDIAFEMIFIRTSEVNFMMGIGSSSLDVDSVSSAYYKQEIGMYHNNNKLASMYGGGDISNWSQGIGTNVIFDGETFYKLKLQNSGGDGALCSIWQVDGDDWDDETELHSWTSDCPADDLILMPFVIPQAANGTYYITGIRY